MLWSLLFTMLIVVKSAKLIPLEGNKEIKKVNTTIGLAASDYLEISVVFNTTTTNNQDSIIENATKYKMRVIKKLDSIIENATKYNISVEMKHFNRLSKKGLHPLTDSISEQKSYVDLKLNATEQQHNDSCIDNTTKYNMTVEMKNFEDKSKDFSNFYEYINGLSKKGTKTETDGIFDAEKLLNFTKNGQEMNIGKNTSDGQRFFDTYIANGEKKYPTLGETTLLIVCSCLMYIVIVKVYQWYAFLLLNRDRIDF